MSLYKGKAIAGTARIGKGLAHSTRENCKPLLKNANNGNARICRTGRPTGRAYGHRT